MALVRAYADLEEMKAVLEGGADVDEISDYTDRCALSYACKDGNLEIVKFLLEKGANPNNEKSIGGLPLIEVVESREKEEKRLEILKLLADKGCNLRWKDKNDMNAVHRAALSDKVEILKYLQEKGVPINDEDDEGITPFTLAVTGSSFQCAKYLLECGIGINDKNSKGSTTFMQMLLNDRMYDFDAVMKFLLENGSDIRLTDANGDSCLKILLMSAVGDDFNPIAGRSFQFFIKLYKDGKFKIDEPLMDGKTALSLAIEKSDYRVMQELLENGADPNQTDENGDSMLIRNCKHTMDRSIIELLYEHDADIDFKNPEGLTVLDVINQSDHDNAQRAKDQIETIQLSHLFGTKQIIRDVREEDDLLSLTRYSNMVNQHPVSPLLFMKPLSNQLTKMDFMSVAKSLETVPDWNRNGSKLYTDHVSYFVNVERSVLVMLFGRRRFDDIMVQVFGIADAGWRAIQSGILNGVFHSLQNCCADLYKLCVSPCMHVRPPMKADDSDAFPIKIWYNDNAKLFAISDYLVDNEDKILTAQDVLCPYHGCLLPAKELNIWLQAKPSINLDAALYRLSKEITDQCMLLLLGLQLSLTVDEIDETSSKYKDKVHLAACALLMKWKGKESYIDIAEVEKIIQEITSC